MFENRAGMRVRAGLICLFMPLMVQAGLLEDVEQNRIYRASRPEMQCLIMHMVGLLSQDAPGWRQAAIRERLVRLCADMEGGPGTD